MQSEPRPMPERLGEAAGATPPAAPQPALRPWRTPTLERLPYAETRNDVGASIDGVAFTSLPV